MALGQIIFIYGWSKKWMPIHSAATRNIILRSYIAVVVSNGAIIPLIFQPHIVCIVVIIDETIVGDPIPAWWEGDVYAEFVIDSFVGSNGVVAAMKSKVDPAIILWDKISLNKVIVAIAGQVNSISIFFCPIAFNSVVSRVFQVDAAIFIIQSEVFINHIIIGKLAQKKAVPSAKADIVAPNQIAAAWDEANGTVAIICNLVIQNGIIIGIGHVNATIVPVSYLIFADIISIYKISIGAKQRYPIGIAINWVVSNWVVLRII